MISYFLTLVSGQPTEALWIKVAIPDITRRNACGFGSRHLPAITPSPGFMLWAVQGSKCLKELSNDYLFSLHTPPAQPGNRVLKPQKAEVRSSYRRWK